MFNILLNGTNTCEDPLDHASIWGTFQSAVDLFSQILYNGWASLSLRQQHVSAMPHFIGQSILQIAIKAIDADMLGNFLLAIMVIDMISSLSWSENETRRRKIWDTVKIAAEDWRRIWSTYPESRTILIWALNRETESTGQHYCARHPWASLWISVLFANKSWHHR